MEIQETQNTENNLEKTKVGEHLFLNFNLTTKE